MQEYKIVIDFSDEARNMNWEMHFGLKHFESYVRSYMRDLLWEAFPILVGSDTPKLLDLRKYIEFKSIELLLCLVYRTEISKV